MSVADRKVREKRQRREAIIDAAERLFFKKGFDGVSMDDIARDLELSKPTIYLYFQDKESLYFAVALRGLRLLHTMYRKAIEKGENSYEKLGAIAYAYSEFAYKYPDYSSVFNYSLSARFDLVNSEEMTEMLELIKENTLAMREVIEAGIKDGVIRSDLDPLEIAVYLIASSSGVFNMSKRLKNTLEAGGISYDQFIRHFMDFTGRAILSDPKAFERLMGDDKFRKRISGR
jgi:AcrR family transcriptional regulator